MSTDLPADLAAALSDRYELRRTVGRGGMATVYLAHDRKHHRDVALKVLLPSLTAHLGVERFLNEIRIAARLTHPHIAALHDSGDADGFLYYVMPYLEGGSLRQRLSGEAPLSVAQALAIAGPIADALTYAHRMGVYHRDIKPENILFSQGHPMIVDFGIAKALSSAGGASLTSPGFLLGTPGYMSPEQAIGRTDLDGRVDVYSLAIIVYEMLVGDIPPPGRWPTDDAVRAGRFLEAPAAHRHHLTVVGSQVERALVRALAPRREERTATPADLIEALSAPGPPPVRYSAGEVQAIVRRATELEAERPTAGGAMSIGGIERLAGEVGVAPELVREAVGMVPFDFGPAPRELTGAVGERFQALAHSPWQWMDPRTAPGDGWGVTDILSLIFFSVITAGVLPFVFIGIARARRRRLRTFFREGMPGTAEILDFREEELGFEVKVSRVRYEFQAGGRTQRGSDLVLPVIADRWRTGERVEILYLPQRNYDSVIISA